jgi:hypothetical protein
MSTPKNSPLTALVNRFLPRLRFPYLFLVLGALFLVDLVVPDPIPLIDELLLAVLTFVAATFTTRREQDPTPRDVTPDEEGRDAIIASEDDPGAGDGSDLPPRSTAAK